MKSIKERVGDIFEIDLGDGHFAHGRVLDKENYAFYDTHATAPLTDLGAIVSKPILFVTAVMRYAITKGRWRVIGHLPLEPGMRAPRRFFKVDVTDPHKFMVYERGKFLPSTREECMSLEILAVWEPEHLEDRLRDHYAGRECRWLNGLYPPVQPPWRK